MFASSNLSHMFQHRGTGPQPIVWEPLIPNYAVRFPSNGTLGAEASLYKPAPNQEFGNRPHGVYLVSLVPSSGGFTLLCALGCVCCRWRWSRAVCSARSQDASSLSPEESPTCCWMKTRCRKHQTPKLSCRRNCGYSERREAGLLLKLVPWENWLYRLVDCSYEFSEASVANGGKDLRNNRWKCSPQSTPPPSGYICIYFWNRLGFCFFNKTLLISMVPEITLGFGGK